VTALQAIALALVAFTGTGVALTRDPTRQAAATGIFGLALAALLTVLQAPDVALAQIAVGGIALPVMVLLALAKIREHGDE
jgi:energy-converting hydrogenase B subunit D